MHSLSVCRPTSLAMQGLRRTTTSAAMSRLSGLLLLAFALLVIAPASQGQLLASVRVLLARAASAFTAKRTSSEVCAELRHAASLTPCSECQTVCRPTFMPRYSISPLTRSAPQSMDRTAPSRPPLSMWELAPIPLPAASPLRIPTARRYAPPPSQTTLPCLEPR